MELFIVNVDVIWGKLEFLLPFIFYLYFIQVSVHEIHFISFHKPII